MAVLAKYYDFGPFRIDTARELLLRDGEPQRLAPKALDLLIYLIRHAERKVHKQELLGALFKNTSKDDSNVTTHIKDLRVALKDSVEAPQWIRNFRGMGYQFIGTVKTSEEIPELSFRPDPKRLTPGEAKAMVCDKRFYCLYWNETGEGVAHAYRLEVIGSNEVVVVEPVSGLMWQKDNFDVDYAGARELIRERNARRVAGFDNWRLPTLEEAMSLMTTPQAGFVVELVRPGIYVGGGNSWDPESSWTPDEVVKRIVHIDRIFDRSIGDYWTADTGSGGHAWAVAYLDGFCYEAMADKRLSVRAVRRM
jgi:DNA-binding winged helix-turn-helix (wHTH) protein